MFSGSAFAPGGTGTPVRPAPASLAPVKVKPAGTREGLRKPPGAPRTQTRNQRAHHRYRGPGRELTGCQPHQRRGPGTVLPECGIPGPGDLGETAGRRTHTSGRPRISSFNKAHKKLSLKASRWLNKFWNIQRIKRHTILFRSYFQTKQGNTISIMLNKCDRKKC